ncbi:MAG: Mur ligase family protein [Patescibacteria group bacterium]
MARKILKKWLRFLASRVLKKYHPRIVAITGSTGKTSTKEAVLTVLKKSKEDNRVVGTQGNLNTEFGVTATIIQPGFTGTESGREVKLTIKDLGQLTWHAIRLLVIKVSYPKVLVLELAADRPGDMKYFMSFIRPEISVLTNIGDVHLEFFGSKSELVEEKSLIIANVDSKGVAILNKEDEFSKLISHKTMAKKVLVSTESEADIYARDIAFGGKGVHFTLINNNQVVQVDLPVFGYQFIYSALFAIAVGDYFGITKNVVAQRLKGLILPKSRFEIIKLGNMVIIDDTYNANPTSTVAALKSLARIGVNRKKIAILGDMRELGSAHQKGHQTVGECAAKVVDQLYVVGDGGQLIKVAAIGAGLPHNQVCDFSNDAVPLILRDNGIVLVKGSKTVRMDKIVELIKDKFYERSCEDSNRERESDSDTSH